MNSAQTLLLNQGFEPIKVISWQRAISLLFLGKVEVLEEYDRDIRSVNLIIKVPAVVRLLRAFRRHARPVTSRASTSTPATTTSASTAGRRRRSASLPTITWSPGRRGG